MQNGEEFWFLVRFIFPCQYRDINPAFVIDNNSAKINQEAKGNRLYLLHYLTVCLWIYFQVIIQTCLVLIIKWFNISTFFLFLPPPQLAHVDIVKILTKERVISIFFKMAIDFGCPTTKDKMEALSISTQALVNVIFMT